MPVSREPRKGGGRNDQGSRAPVEAATTGRLSWRGGIFLEMWACFLATIRVHEEREEDDRSVCCQPTLDRLIYHQQRVPRVRRSRSHELAGVARVSFVLHSFTDRFLRRLPRNVAVGLLHISRWCFWQIVIYVTHLPSIQSLAPFVSPT